jgi:uncharacterized protein involved in exopolysaccharide biosynthesis
MAQRNLMIIDNSRSNHLFLRDMADRLFRQKRLILSAFALLNLGFVVYLLCLPTSYEAEMQFLINNTRADTLVSSESTNGQVTRSYVDETVIATEIQLLSNKEILRDAVQKCSLAKDRSAKEVEKALKDLQKELRVSPVLKANMIRATYSSSNPDEAATVLRTLADGYLNEHLRVHSPSGTYEFFDQQARFYEQQLKDLQGRLTEFQGQRNIVHLGQQKDLNLRKLVDLEASLKETEAAYRESDQRIRTLKQQVGNIKARITTQARTLPNQYSVEHLNTMLAELQNRRTELLTKFRPEDRMIQQVDQQILDTKTAMDRASKLTATEEATDVNPLRQSLEAELAKAQANSTGLRSRAGSLSNHVAEYRSSLGALENSTADDDQLLREIKKAEDAFFLYSKKREEARIAAAMDRQKIANVILVQPPRAPQLPKPKLTGGVLAAYSLCSLMILGFAFLTATAWKTVYTPWELEGLTGLPVLASFESTSAPPIRLGWRTPQLRI